MLHDCCVTHVSWVIWDLKRKCAFLHLIQVRVKASSCSGQATSSFQFQHFLPKICLCCSAVSLGSKNIYYFDVRH